MPVEFWLVAVALVLPAMWILLRPVWARDVKKAKWFSVFVLFTVIVGSVAIYAPRSFNYAAAVSAQRMVEEAEDAYIENVAAIREELEATPNKAELWLQLAETHADSGRFELAFSAYDEAERRRPLSVQESYRYAETIVWSRSEQYLTTARRILDDLLAQRDELPRPQYLAILWLSGVVFNDQENYSAAMRDWQLLLSLLPEDADATIREQLLRGIRAVEATMRESAAEDSEEIKLRVAVDVAPALRERRSANGTLLVYAKMAAGDGEDAASPIPLAVARVATPQLPTTITLSRANAMMQGMSLNDVERVVVTARLSETGQAVPQSGDLYGESSTIEVRSVDEADAIRIEIDRIVP